MNPQRQEAAREAVPEEMDAVNFAVDVLDAAEEDNNQRRRSRSLRSRVKRPI